MPDPLPENIELEALPFEEAMAFWESRIPMSRAAMQAAGAAIRARAFTVSRVARMDVLMDLFGAVTSAIENGETLVDFQTRLSDIMTARGWKGIAAWHAETVFRNNIQTSYMVGRYAQMREQADDFPFWEYDAVNDSRTRPTHAALDGKVFPADHKFWDKWYPPNGHRCRCSVNPVSRIEVEEEGLEVETDDPTGTLIEPVDERGNRLPARMLIPDLGWDENPGKTTWGPDLGKYPEALRQKYEEDVA